MTYRLVMLVILGKGRGNGRFYTIDGDINPINALEIAKDRINDCKEIIISLRQSHPRPYKRLPDYIRFYIMSGGCPRYEKPRCIGQFEIPMNGEEPRIIKEWR